MKLSRKQVVIVASILILAPVLGWWLLVSIDVIGRPGDPVRPPFNLSDRIVTIDVVQDESGKYRGRFDGWKPGDPELSGDEFYEELYRRERSVPSLYKFFDVTSLTGVLWVLFGFAGQAVFMGRMLAQWYASERASSSVVPPIFWWLSLLGSTMLMVYFVWRKEIVGFLGQSTGWLIYIRNLWFIYGQKKPSRKKS